MDYEIMFAALDKINRRSYDAVGKECPNTTEVYGAEMLVGMEAVEDDV